MKVDSHVGTTTTTSRRAPTTMKTPMSLLEVSAQCMAGASEYSPEASSVVCVRFYFSTINFNCTMSRFRLSLLALSGLTHWNWILPQVEVFLSMFGHNIWPLTRKWWFHLLSLSSYCNTTGSLVSYWGFLRKAWEALNFWAENYIIRY